MAWGTAVVFDSVELCLVVEPSIGILKGITFEMAVRIRADKGLEIPEDVVPVLGK
jgi:hypothetical protein